MAGRPRIPPLSRPADIETLDRLGIQPGEEWDYRNIMSNGYTSREAVDILRRSRRKSA